MTDLHIAHGLSLPLKAAGQTIAVTGIRGSGKTNTAGVFVEEALDAGLPALILDPTDSWWGLKTDYEVLIFGGDHGDLPLDEGQGKTLAEFVVAERVPVILSTAHLGMNAQRRLVTELLVELYKLKGKDANRYPLLVVIDEAPMFVPQRFQGGMEAASVGAVERIVAQGRRFGFGVILISQRAATINKNVLTQAETLVIHRLTSPQDRKALKEWVEENASTEQMKAIAESLAGQPQGDAWVWSPGLDILKHVHIRARRTFDSSSSPELGKKLTPPKNLKQVDLDRWKGRLAAAIEQRDANDPVALRKQVGDLKRQLAERPAAEPVVERVEVEVVPAWLEPLLAELGHQLNDVGVNMNGAHQRLLNERTTSGVPVQRVPARVHLPAPAPHRAAAQAPSNGRPEFRAGAIRILKELGARHPATYTRPQVGALTRFAHRGGTFTTYLGELKREGLVDETGGELRITPAGLAYLGGDVPAAPTTHAAVMAMWRNALRSGAYRMLEVVVRQAGDPNGITRAALAEAVEMEATGGTFTTYLGDLRRNGLIKEAGNKHIFPNEVLWP